MSNTTSSPPPGYYHAQGDPPGTVRFWNGAQWLGGPSAPAGTRDREITVTAGGEEESVAPIGSTMRLASPGRRIGARLLDFLVWLTIAVLVALILGVDVGGTLQAEIGLGASFAQNLLWFVLVAALEGGLVASRGATLGKLALDIQVTNAHGRLPGVRAAFLRIAPLGLIVLGSFGSWSVLIMAFVSLVLLFADAQHQTLWDKLAKTVVVDRPS